MAGAREFLERLRPGGTPGAAALAGVPADRVAERSAELEPVLDLLADTQEEAHRIRGDARHEAARRREAGAHRARALLAQARRECEAERRSTAAQARAAAEDAARRRAAEAEAEAVRVTERAAARIPALVDGIVAAARRELEAAASGAAPVSGAPDEPGTGRP